MKLVCPTPLATHSHVTLAHGGGGRLMHQLLERTILPTLNTKPVHDGTELSFEAGRKLAYTTDSYVVNPIFFPGGDIGKLAIYGTCNDLAMCAARPRYLSLGLILEEGLAMEELERVLTSMAQASKECGIQIVTGDTKVVDRGKGDKVFINTSGIGEVQSTHTISPAQIREGDAVIVSGDLGRHGMTILAERQGMHFDSGLMSDCANLWPSVEALLKAKVEIHCLRDMTRGGMATTLLELVQTSELSIQLQEELIPVSEAVKGSCELLGLDPYYVACEGRCAYIVPEKDAEKALSALRKTTVSSEAVRIGTVQTPPKGAKAQLLLQSPYGVSRRLEMLSGEQLPRIC